MCQQASVIMIVQSNLFKLLFYKMSEIKKLFTLNCKITIWFFHAITFWSFNISKSVIYEPLYIAY